MLSNIVMTITDEAAAGNFFANFANPDANEFQADVYAAHLVTNQPLVWTFQGSAFNAPGYLSGNVTPGSYLWYAYITNPMDPDTPPVITQPIYKPIRAATFALHERCILDVLDKLALVDLPGLQEVKRQRYPHDWNVDSNCLIVSALEQNENVFNYTNLHDNIGLPVYLLRKQRPMNANETTEEADWHMCRQNIRRSFRAQRLATVPESRRVTIEPAQVGVMDDSQIERVYSGYVLLCDCREPRGLNA